MKKINGKFSVRRRGYCLQEVDEYVKSTSIELDGLKSQLELALEMKEENAKIREELETMRSREREIKSALSAAIEKADDIKTDIKLQYALEIERLKLFQAKWTSAYEEIAERYHFDKDALNLEGVVAETSLQLERLLLKDFGIRLSPSSDEAEQQFRAETERLEISQDEINKLVEKLKSELKKAG